MATITAQTATPIIFVNTVLPGKSSASGWVGTYNADGTTVPEPNAYIYIYINGFLINPPDLNSDGTFRDPRLAIISDANGNWQTTSFFFNVYAPFKYGQSFVVRAKAPFKNISDRSIPYAIGSTPTPTDLGVAGDFGVIRPPYDGETSITGKISYWTNQITSGELFDCSTRVFVYVEGIRVGEVLRNEIRGSNATYPLADSLKGKTLALKVANNTVTVPLDALAIDDRVSLLGTQDSANTNFLYFLPTNQASLRVFRNGLRQQLNVDYIQNEDPVLKQGTVTFFTPPAPDDVLTGLLTFQASEIRLGEVPKEIPDGTITDFTLTYVPKLGTLEVFLNGAHLTGLNNQDYIVTNNIVSFTTPPLTGDVIIFDYQTTSTKDVLIKTQVPVQVITGVNTYYAFNAFPALGNFHIFLNGVLQREGTNLDYIKIDDQTVQFNPWVAPQSTDTIIVQFYVSPITIATLINYLNARPEFQNNCLTADKYIPVTPDNFAPLAGIKDGVNKVFTFVITDSAVIIRVWRNGVRQVLGVDYTVDYTQGTVTFVSAPFDTDVLLGVFQYVTDNVVLNELPVVSPYDTNNTIYALKDIPIPSTVQIYRNGVRLYPFNNFDYSVSSIRSNEFILVTPLSVTDTLVVDYQPAYSGSVLFSSQAPVGATDGTNRTYLYSDNTIGSTLMVYRNGLLQANDYDYSVYKNAITFSNSVPGGVPPQPFDVILVDLNSSTLVTTDVQDQLKITSPYELELYTDLSQFNVPVTTSYPLTVNITDPNLLSVGYFFVGVSIDHPKMEELKIRLIPPQTTHQIPVILLNNRKQADGTINFGVGMTGANLVKTVFDQNATGSIYNNLGGQRSIGHFRPEQGSLNNFLGLLPAQINGTWFLEITDYRNGDTGTLGEFQISFNPLAFNVDPLDANQPFTSTGGVINDALIDSGPYYQVNNLLFGTAPFLYPGKDTDGTFMFSINKRTSYWKYTNYNPVTGVTTPFVKQQHITARALNPTPFTYQI